MANSSTPSYTVTRRIYPEPWQADIINRKMDLGNRMYNNAVRHYKSVVEELRQDLWFIRNLEAWKACGEDDPGKEDFSNEVSACISAYGLDEYDIHAYMARGKIFPIPKGLGSTSSRNLALPCPILSGRLFSPARRSISGGMGLRIPWKKKQPAAGSSINRKRIWFHFPG